MATRADCYVSVDIEADGPIPGPYSMLALGISAAGRLSDEGFERLDPDERSLYLELKPISDAWEEEALRISGLDRARLLEEGVEPAVAMRRAATWMRETAGGDRLVVCAFPAGFDWLFLYWYLEQFAADLSPLDFSSCLDMKTLFAAKAGAAFDEAGREQLPTELQSARAHTHNALDDAKEQAEVFANLMEWDPPRR